MKLLCILLNHKYNEWEEVGDNFNIKVGILYRSCKRCGDVEHKRYPWVDEQCMVLDKQLYSELNDIKKSISDEAKLVKYNLDKATDSLKSMNAKKRKLKK